MKIYSSKKFGFGLVLIALSYIPFSYMNHAKKYKMENCDKIDGMIREVKKTHTKYGKQDGWSLSLEEVSYKIRIIGEYYNAMNHDRFQECIKPGAQIEVYLLKDKYDGIFEGLNKDLGIRNAAAITCSGTEILGFKSIRKRLGYLFIMNLVFGLIAVGMGLKYIVESVRPTTDKGV